jgi:hypothetical protein
VPYLPSIPATASWMAQLRQGSRRHPLLHSLPATR